MTRPQTTEAAPYYFKYIDLITSDEIVPTIKSQLGETLEFLQGVSEEQSTHAYAPGKWTIREVLNHVNDGERLFLGRAFWFARGFQDPLPSFDQDLAVRGSAGKSDALGRTRGGVPNHPSGDDLLLQQPVR